MSLNKFMHPRNPYKIPPDFRRLALDYPEFRKHAKQSLAGKIILDYKDPDALRALTTCLLQRDFNLLLDLPPNRLVPTLPLRLNYILWIEDLLSPKTESINGIDIGTGASCVYPLLAGRKHGWKMLAIEKDDLNCEYAKKNVEANNLGNLIQVSKSEGEPILVGRLDPQTVYDFSMCNPPFFANEKDAISENKSRKSNRHEPHSTPTGSLPETVVEGGEVAFVKTLIEESVQLKDQIRIFTTMLGHKSSVNPVKQALGNTQVASISSTEFCQGNTMRWGIAWTFQPDTQFSDTSHFKKVKQKQPLTYLVPRTENYNIQEIANKIRTILTDIQVEFTLEKLSKKSVSYTLNAARNTWSHDRRRRRRIKRDSETWETSFEETKTAELEKPRTNEAETDEPPLKRPKTDQNGDTGSTQEGNSIALRCSLQIQQAGPTIALHFNWLEGELGREAMHQVLQYLKNRLSSGVSTCSSTSTAVSEDVSKENTK
nr:EOG090X04JL [Lepidurus arcticus]